MPENVGDFRFTSTRVETLMSIKTFRRRVAVHLHARGDITDKTQQFACSGRQKDTEVSFTNLWCMKIDCWIGTNEEQTIKILNGFRRVAS